MDAVQPHAESCAVGVDAVVGRFWLLLRFLPYEFHSYSDARHVFGLSGMTCGHQHFVFYF